MIKTVREYLDKHYANSYILPSSSQIALEILNSKDTDINLRLAVATMLDGLHEDIRIARIRNGAFNISVLNIVEATRLVEEEWMQLMRKDRKKVGKDLAQWIIGRKVGEVAADGVVVNTCIHVDHLDRITFRTSALVFLVIDFDGDLIVYDARRLDPLAASHFE